MLGLEDGFAFLLGCLILTGFQGIPISLPISVFDILALETSHMLKIGGGKLTQEVNDTGIPKQFMD